MTNNEINMASSSVPLLINILGIQAPALSLLIGLTSVILTRVMLIAGEPSKKKWYYDVALTILLTLMVFVIIIDRKLGPGMSLILGVGSGASGVFLVDIMKRKVEGIIEGLGK